MKKQIFLITMIVAAVCLTGCGGNMSISAAQPNAVPLSAAETTVQEAAQTTAAEAVLTTTTAATAAAANTTAAPTVTAVPKAAPAVTTAPAVTAAPAATAAITAYNAQAGADIRNIAGTWTQADVSDPATLTVKADGKYELRYRDGRAQTGKAEAEFAYGPDGVGDYWYLCYKGDGTFWASFRKREAQATELYCIGDTPMRFLAGSANTAEQTAEVLPDVSKLAGEWDYQELDQTQTASEVFKTIGVIRIESSGSFVYQADNGTRKSGTIRAGFEEFADGDKVPTFSFIEDNGTFWTGMYDRDSEHDIRYFGNGGVYRMVRK